MAQRWSPLQEDVIRTELVRLYVTENKTIGEIGRELGLSDKTIFQRLQRLGLHTTRDQKKTVNNKRCDIVIPQRKTVALAELFGVLLGDGHISRYQILVSVGSKEDSYATYVSNLIEKVFAVRPKISLSKRGHKTVYLGSIEIVRWLRAEGLVAHKTRGQVDVPLWLQNDERFGAAFIRGFFDTDGSIYRLRYGTQISFTNTSVPLLISLRNILKTLGYNPSVASSQKVYLTRRSDVERFMSQIRPANQKHVRRYKSFAPVV